MIFLELSRLMICQELFGEKLLTIHITWECMSHFWKITFKTWFPPQTNPRLRLSCWKLLQKNYLPLIFTGWSPSSWKSTLTLLVSLLLVIIIPICIINIMVETRIIIFIVNSHPTMHCNGDFQGDVKHTWFRLCLARYYTPHTNQH